jgi:predicted anti-sigma-YlaC factor YlaD
MLNCKEVTEVCSAELERPLRLGEQVALRTHLMMCTGCTQYRKQLKTLREVMQAYAAGRAITDEAGGAGEAT